MIRQSLNCDKSYNCKLNSKRPLASTGVMLCHVILCYAMLCYVVYCYAMLCYNVHAMLCYAMLHYVVLLLFFNPMYVVFELCINLTYEQWHR